MPCRSPTWRSLFPGNKTWRLQVLFKCIISRTKIVNFKKVIRKIIQKKKQIRLLHMDDFENLIAHIILFGTHGRFLFPLILKKKHTYY